MKHKFFHIIIIVAFLSPTVFAQDIHFSQFSQTPLKVNPAQAGIFNGEMRVQLNYRDQWKSMGTPYRTYAMSYDMTMFKQKWKNSYLGLGLSAFKDKAGDTDLSTTQFNLSLSSIVGLNPHHYVSVGLDGGFAQRTIDYTKIRTGSQFNGFEYDPSLPTGETNNLDAFNYWDISTGATWNYSTDETNIAANDKFRANAGIAFFHLNKPEQEFNNIDKEKLYAKLVVHGGMNLSLRYANTALVPSIIYMQQGPTTELNLGMFFRVMLQEESRYTGLLKETAILLGGFYRVGDALIPAITLEVSDFALGISYDVTTSGLKSPTSGRGGIEISLRYINPNPFNWGQGTKKGNTKFL